MTAPLTAQHGDRDGDNLKIKDGRDKAQVNKNEKWEVDQVMKTEHVRRQTVLDAIEKVGPNRQRVVEEIRKNKK